MNTIESNYDSSLLVMGDAESHLSESTVPMHGISGVGRCSDSLFVRYQDYFRRVLFDSILYIEASGGGCVFYLGSGIHFPVTFALIEVIQHLPQPRFLQVHRSFIINTNHIETYIGNMFTIGKAIIPIGRVYKKEVLSHFNILGMV